jgi:uncharacterized Zn finger protein
MSYANLTPVVTVDQIISAMESHNPIVNNDTVLKAYDHTVYIMPGDTNYRVRSTETGNFYHVDVATMTCNCPAGQHGQNCSHALAAARRHVHLMDGFRMDIMVEQVDGQIEMIFS